MTMVSAAQREKAQEILRDHGTTFAADASIRLADKPAPLYQLSVLVTLLSKPIGADLAIAGTRELLRAGFRTPQKMHGAGWQHRVDALGRGHYRRFDESTATILESSSSWVLQTWRGDLRRLAEASDREPATARERLQEMPGIGELGASIYCREAQAVWTWLRPYSDERVATAAKDVGLPHSVPSLVELAGSDDLSTLGAALIRATS